MGSWVNRRGNGWVLWGTGAAQRPGHSGLLRLPPTLLPGPSVRPLLLPPTAPPSQPSPNCMSGLQTQTTASLLRLPLPPTPLHVAAIGALAPGRLPFISNQTAMSSDGNMLLPLRRRRKKTSQIYKPKRSFSEWPNLRTMMEGTQDRVTLRVAFLGHPLL